MEELPSYYQGELESGNCYYFRHRTHPTLCPRTGGTKMTLLRRCLIILFLQIGCLALDHSTREIGYEEDEIQLIMGHQFRGEHVRLVDNDLEGTGFANPGSESHPSLEKNIISFHPKSFNFKESPVGVPRLGVVRVDNRLKDENLKLISISGNTVHFHSSFFADKVISPGGNTTFDVVFLSRMEGLVESSLYIHTSKGMFKYYVRGFGLPNPYRLKPLVGARIPVNGSYEPLITMHNPHNVPIQVVEMLSSGTDFHLELPDGVAEGSEGRAWAIEPFQTKSVMKGSFHARAEGNHSGYIKIRVNSTTLLSEYLYVPVEVQVSASARVYSPQDSLDFGLMIESDKPRTLPLSLINAQNKPVNIQSISVRGNENPAIRIEFRPLVLEPESGVSTVVALVTFDPAAVEEFQQTHGVIEIRSECGEHISIPFRSNFLQGELLYNTSSLGFFIKGDATPIRNFSLRSNFTVPVAVYHVNVSHPEALQVVNFNSSQVILPGEQKVVLKLKVNKKAHMCDAKAGIRLVLKTNVTNLRLPISCYDGKLGLYTGGSTLIDFGRIELLTAQTDYFAIDNSNPVEVRLKSWSSNSSWAQVELVGMQEGSKEDLGLMTDFENLKKSLFLQPGHLAVFSVDIKKPVVEGSFHGEAYVTTDHDQTIRVPFRFAVSKGCVTSEAVKFDKVFPGKISFEKLYLSSSLNHTVSVKRVHPGSSSLMWFTPSNVQDDLVVLPKRKNYVGKVYFDVRKSCGSQCYSGFAMESPLGKLWMQGISLKEDTEKLNHQIYATLANRYESVKHSEWVNTSLWVETQEDGAGGYKVKTKVNFIWPRLCPTKVVVFPLTALNNVTIVDIPVSNPSSLPIVVQAVLATHSASLLTDIYNFSSSENFTAESLEAFALDGVTPSSSQPNGTLIFTQVQRQLVQDMLGLQNSSGILFLLQPGAKFLLKAKFRPITKDLTSAVLLLRNNLTGIETSILRGRAGTGQLTLGNGISGSSLLFQLTEKLLHGCHNEQSSKYVPPQLTVRRSFIARNIGEIPLEIKSIEIFPSQGSLLSTALSSLSNPYDACEGYGFRVLNCYPFTLLPNQTHSLDIAFTPDFTMARVVRSLRLTDYTGSTFNYSLVAMVPSGMLGICAAIISRPSWEPILKYIIGGGIIIAIVAAALMAYFEAGSVVSSAVVATIRVIPADSKADITKEQKEVTTKLDLKAVYDKVDNRFKRHQNHISSSSTHSSSNLSSSCYKQIIGDQKDPVSSPVNLNVSLRSRKKKTQVYSAESALDASNGMNKSGKASSASSATASAGKASVPNAVSTDVNPTCAVPPNNAVKKNENKKKKANSTPLVQPIVQKPKENKASSLGNLTALGVKAHNGSSRQQEDETSSTTTESSNPDDVMMAVMMARCDEEMREKERSYSGKSGSSGSSNDSYNGLKSKVAGKELRKGSLKDSVLIGFNTITDYEELSKKNRTKKKDYNSRRVPSPGKLEGGLWDTPKIPGDGLSELAAQTQEFLSRPSKRDTANISNIGHNGHLTGLTHGAHHYVVGTSQSNGNRIGSRKPPISAAGVIGQHRLHPQMMTAQPTAQNAFIESFLTSALTMTVASTHGSIPPGSRPLPQNRPGRHAWGTEILPENRCDLWLQQNATDNGDFAPATSSSSYRNLRQETNNVFMDSPGYFGQPNGYIPQHSLKTSNGLSPSNQVFLQPAATRAKSSTPTPDSQYFTTSSSSNDGWPTFSPYDNHPRAALETSRYISNLKPNAQAHATTSGALQRSFLPRVPSDSSSRRGFTAGEWGSACFDSSHGSISPATADAPKETSDLNKWQSGSSSPTNQFGNWGGSSNASSPSTSTNSVSVTKSLEMDTVGTATEIWDANASAAAKWPMYNSSAATHGFPGSTSIASTRASSVSSLENATTSVGELGLRGRVADVAQSHREVEAGLGFNPFTSDIWNQNQPETPGWTSNFNFANPSE